MVSICLQMPTELWDECAKAYEKDIYTDWEQRNKVLQVGVGGAGKVSELSEDAKTITQLIASYSARTRIFMESVLAHMIMYDHKDIIRVKRSLTNI